MIIPRLYVLSFKNNSPAINNALFIKDKFRDAECDGDILDITNFPFILFDDMSIDYALKKAGFKDFTSEDVLEVGRGVGQRQDVSLARRAYIAALRLAVLNHIDDISSYNQTFSENRRYSVVLDGDMPVPLKDNLKKYNIVISDVSDLPCVPVSLDLVRSFLLDTDSSSILDDDLMSLAAIASLDKAVEDIRLLYTKVAQAGCVNEWQNILAQRKGEQKATMYRTQQESIHLSLTEQDFVSLKEEMQIPSGFKKIPAREVGKATIGDLMLKILLNRQSNVSSLDFRAFVPSDNKENGRNIDSFVLAFDISELKDMDFNAFKSRISDEVATCQIAEVLSNSVKNTSFWG